MSMWQITVVEGLTVTRLIIGCEAPARDLHGRLLKLGYRDVNISIIEWAPERSDEEHRRVAAILQIIYYNEGGQDGTGSSREGLH